MAFKSVSPAPREFVKPRKWLDWKKGEFVDGVLIECEEKDKFKKPIFAVEVTNSNFDYPIGTPIYLNCGGNFRNMMDAVEVGEKVRILYRGQNKMGPKSSHPGELTHDIDVQIDDGSESASEDGLL